MTMTAATVLGMSMIAGAITVNAAHMDYGYGQKFRNCYSQSMDGRMIISEPGQSNGQPGGMDNRFGPGR